MTLKSRAIALLEEAGITVNGPNPWDIQVHDGRLYGRVLRQGSLGLGESYMDGWWSAEAVDQFIYRLLVSGLDQQAGHRLTKLALGLSHRLFNLQSQSRAFMVGKKHYDLGNDFYERMLDPYMQYSCGYWKEADTLDTAEEAKLRLIGEKLKLERGMRVLDIGCGWGGLARYLVTHYAVEVVGITVSIEQQKYARKFCDGLPVDIRFKDYRRLTERYDRVVSVGMFEHVGYKNYGTYMQVARRCLEPDGIFLLHAIGGNRSVTGPDPFMGKYIFPNGMLPSARQITRAYEGVFEVMEDWHNFGLYYDPTLMAWNHNFQHAWPELARMDSERFDQRFKRMWEFYLLSCAALFRARRAQLFQVVLSPYGVKGGYESVR